MAQQLTSRAPAPISLVSPFENGRQMAANLFKRCVQCPSGTPQCQSCPTGQQCALQIQSCDQCSYTYCVVDPNAQSTSSSSSSNPAGPIAGGVVGGIVAIAIITFLIWWFFIRKKKQQQVYEQSMYDDARSLEKMQSHTTNDDFNRYRSTRASTHTMASVASTFHDPRASNIIPIAFIPGITSRTPGEYGDNVPPVPPIPAAAHSGTNTPRQYGEDLYLPSEDFRKSQSQYSPKTGRQSMSSIASTVFHNGQIVEPQQAMAVSVIAGSKASSPGVSRTGSRHGSPLNSPRLHHMGSQSSIAGRMAPRTVHISKSNGALRRGAAMQPQLEIAELAGSEASPVTHNHSTTNLTVSPFVGIPEIAELESDVESATASFSAGSGRPTRPANQRRFSPVGEETPELDAGSSPHSHFEDVEIEHELDSGSASRRSASTDLNKQIEDATWRARQLPQHGGMGAFTPITLSHSQGTRTGSPGEKEKSPFGDENATKTP